MLSLVNTQQLLLLHDFLPTTRSETSFSQNVTNNVTTVIGFSYMSPNEVIVSLFEDAVSILLMLLVLIPLGIVFFKRHCYLIWKFMLLMMFASCSTEKRMRIVQRWRSNERTKAKVFFFLLLNAVCSFVVFRIFGEISTLMQHYFEWKREADPFIKAVLVRRIFDYCSIFWYTLNFSFIIPLWLKVCLSWINKDSIRKFMRFTVAFLLIVADVSALVGLSPITSLAMVGLIRKDWASGLDKLKKPFTVYIALPLVGLSTSIVFFMSIAAVVIIVVMLSHQYRSKLKTQPCNTTSNKKKIDLQSDQYQQQRQAIIKLTSGIVILATGILLEAIGAILHALDVASYYFFPITKALPYAAFAICVSLIFWPYSLPILRNPIQFLEHSTPAVSKQKNKSQTTMDLGKMDMEGNQSPRYIKDATARVKLSTKELDEKTSNFETLTIPTHVEMDFSPSHVESRACEYYSTTPRDGITEPQAFEV